MHFLRTTLLLTTLRNGICLIRERSCQPSLSIRDELLRVSRSTKTTYHKSLHSSPITSRGMSDKTGVSVVYVTCPTSDVAKSLSRGLIENKLAACVNLIPQVLSIYEWEGKVEEEGETLMIIKTQDSVLDKLTDYVKKNHPYDVPEVISLPVTGGSGDYLDWVKKQVK